MAFHPLGVAQGRKGPMQRFDEDESVPQQPPTSPMPVRPPRLFSDAADAHAGPLHGAGL
jgi:hypothetical protein